MARITPSEAQAVINRITMRRVLRNAALAAAAGGAVRATTGIAGNIGKNYKGWNKRLRAGRDPGEIVVAIPEEEEAQPKTAGLNRWKMMNKKRLARQHDMPEASSAIAQMIAGRKKKAEDLAVPSWAVPAYTLGVPMSFFLGVAGTNRLIREVRKAQTARKMQQARKEFDNALAEERNTKFARDLHELAQAHVHGDLPNLLSWRPKAVTGLAQGAGSVARGTAGLYATVATILAGLGGAAGWRMVGKGPNASKVEAYDEAMRRWRVANPLTLTARTQRVKVKHPPQTENEDQDEDGQGTV